MSGWLNLCNTVPDSSRPGNRPILKFTKYVYQVLMYYKAGRNLSETRLSLDVCHGRQGGESCKIGETIGDKAMKRGEGIRSLK